MFIEIILLDFFNPVQIMKLVEVIRTEYTSTEVFDKTVAWVEDIGKVPGKKFK